MDDAVKIVRITRNDWERVQQHAVAFEPFHQALTRALDKLGEYECEYEDEPVNMRWDDDERLRPEPERREVEDALRADEEARRNA